MVNLFFSESFYCLLFEKKFFFNFKLIDFEKVFIKKTLFWPILGIETHYPVGPISELESILDYFQKEA